MKNLLTIFVCLLIGQIVLATPYNNPTNPEPNKKTIKLKRGTIVTLQLIDDVNSMDMEMDNTIEMMVLVGVEKNGKTLIASGTYAEGRITRARRAGVFGKGAFLELEGTSIKTVDGQRISIGGVKTMKRGRDRKPFAVGISIGIPAIGVIMGTPMLLPFAAIGLLIKGKEVEIEKGTLLRTKLKEDLIISVK